VKFWYEGKLFDTSTHDCARMSEQPCVFCEMNTEMQREGHNMYAVPYDIEGIYDPKGEPNVVIVKLEDE
jgi:hypothetical protein